MKDKELCEKFIAADKIINGEIEGNLTLGEIINDPKFKEYCPNNKCETYMKLNGFGEYLFDQLGTEIENEYYEYFMMWLSDKLFKIANEDDKSQNNGVTLNEAYDKYLKKNIKNGIYWSLLDIKQGLKEVNLMHMKHFYKLLNDICKAIVYYKPNKDDTEKFINYSTECYNQYSSLYYSVPKCDSYLHLLDNLKRTYEGFKNSVHEEIKKTYPHLEGRLQTLTIENNNSYFVEKLKEFDFNSSDCKPQKAKEPSSPKKEEKPPGPQSASQKSGTSPQSKPKDSENSEGNTKDTPGNKGNSNSKNRSSEGGSGIGEGGGSKTPGDQNGTNSSGTFYGYWSSTLGSRLNFLNYLPSASEIYETQKNILTNVSNQVSNAYNSAKTIAQDTYDKTVTTVKDAYSATTIYISDGFSSITNQLSSLGSFFQLGDDQSGSGSSGNGSSTDNNPLKTLQTPESDPNPVPRSPPQTPSQSSSNQAQDPSSPKEPSSTQDSQDTVQNGASNTLQQPDPNTGAGGVQTLPITQVTLLSSSTDPSTQGNGSITGTVVKMNEKSSIWCIAQNKKYGILGIGIISISIFAFLAIMYKYLSFGCTSKSKRKKNVKKVINSIEGERPIQIIIKSYDRNKDLKPVINSVGRKKDPLLNIYKLMQADPVPFINVFFLLIFFVYKRQLNYLEL
ncbi:PIR protein CIR protein [Plasmodium vinckei lentum]|uniref:PIR protein CIR protein n=1 Tax=Plasmodium vinckei lentum TaxID=138297 RepID=A0A6V7SG21_PLAVN|nr:PIR protein CIR protein [Plasmodium vinckei lentum]